MRAHEAVRRRRPRRALRRLVLAGVVAGVVVGVVLGLAYLHLGPSAAKAGGGRGTGTVASPTTSSLPRTTTTTQPPVSADGTYAVGTTEFDAGATGAPAGTPGSQLATNVWFPAVRSSSGRTVPDRAHGPYPLLVFSQGYKVAPTTYQVLLSAWASAGYVVAAPTYPHTDNLATYVDENDIVNHPAELRSVIDAVLVRAERRGSVMDRLVNPTEIGLVGQSDGGDVTLALAANTRYRYPGVKAVAILSGAELVGFGGTYFSPTTAPTPPLLVVQDNADPINVPACSAQLYDNAPSPKWYLDLLGAAQLATAHLTPYVRPNSYESVVAKVTTAFFDAELLHQPEALAAMTASGNVPAVAQLSDAATAPPATGSCPGAP